MTLAGIDGKVAIVTGAGQGIGRGYALALGREGASVVVADVNAPLGEETTELVKKNGGSALFVETDVTSEASTAAMAQAAVNEFDRIDILVNNAGLWGGLKFQSPEEITTETWNRVMSVNVTGVWLCTKAVVPVMEQQGGGVIVNQSSVGAYVGGPLLSHYCTSKGAVNAFTKAMAKDLGESGIRVNALAPGVIATESTLTTASEDLLDMLEMQQCIKRKGTTEDLVGPMLFLASDASRFMTGQVIAVDGGLVLLG